ncbi:TIGR03086 family metal-binding protein [Pseudonocardia xishanensis]|uniref:TIGR03086 family metal-binding protein n=1 Tax=Pseudonocardia xishanensis TaxID=630995 RepID=A0ABP8RJR5_9PSEU
MTTTEIDPRTSYAGALDWAATVVDGVRPDQRGLPTPCPELDVDGLLRHLVATVHKIAAIGDGADPTTLPFQVPTGDCPALAAARAEMERVWSADDALAREVRVPWGTAPGAVALWGYVNELLVHTWDVAVATGQHPEAPAGLVEPVLGAAQRLIPEQRDGSPFAPAVTPRPEAGPTERLANWSGHRW